MPEPSLVFAPVGASPSRKPASRDLEAEGPGWDPDEVDDVAPVQASHSRSPRHPVTARPRNIGRKIMGKAAPPEFVPKRYLAVCPEAMSEPRLFRELGAPVFGLNLGARNPKPGRLELLAFPTAPSTAPSLTMILGKEDGETSYAAKPLFESPTGVKILEVAQNQQEAYSQMVLLRTPRRRCAARHDGDSLFRPLP